MHKDYEKLFSRLKPVEPPDGLFERVILAIKREQELQHRKRLLFSFFALLIVSIVAAPFSWMLFMNQVKESGILYFISTAFSDIKTTLVLWRDFGWAILESLPITGIAILTINIGLALYAFQLFFKRRRLLA